MPTPASGPDDNDLPRVAYRLTADLAQPNAAIYWTDLIASAAIGYAAIAIWYISDLTAIGIAAAIVAILALYRCVSFIHELNHLRRRAPRYFRAGWHVLVGVPMLLPAFFYEGIHDRHHEEAHYGTAEDPEYIPLVHGWPFQLPLLVLGSAFAPLLLVLRFVIATPLATFIPRLRRRVIARMSGLVMNPQFRRSGPQPVESWRAAEWATTLFALIAAGLLVAGIVPWTFAAIWLATWAGVSVINIMRALAAHHYASVGEPLDAVAQLRDSVNVPPPALLPMLWAPLGLRYHALHHLLPHLPYHALGAAHRRLMRELPADSAYRDTAHPRATEVLAMLVRRRAQAMAARGATLLRPRARVS